MLIGSALVYRGQVSLSPVPITRRIAIVPRERPSRERPIVMVDGPRTERHRFREFRPLPLSLWYANDPPDQQWRLKDGFVGLIDLTDTLVA